MTKSLISVITCSIKPDICKKMLDSISKTIGCEYETIVFDNREKNYGICKAYNEAASKANGDYLCFVHEDIEIKTDNWGRNLIEFASNAGNCGVIGLAGGHCVAQNFMIWWANENGTSLINIYDPNGSNDGKPIYKYNNPNSEVFSKAVCIDGVFLFVKKDIWQENVFDEKNFSGFHFYDADFSFAVALKYQNYVYFEMDVHHFSGGSMDRTFCENIYIFQKKWKHKLPYCLPGYKITYRDELNMANGVHELYLKNGFSKTESLKRILKINGAWFMSLFLLKKIKGKLRTLYRKMGGGGGYRII